MIFQIVGCQDYVTNGVSFATDLDFELVYCSVNFDVLNTGSNMILLLTSDDSCYNNDWKWYNRIVDMIVLVIVSNGW